jgi:hypothetical protein
MKRMRYYNILIEVCLGNLGMDGRMILKYILRNWVGTCELGSSWLGLGVAVES